MGMHLLLIDDEPPYRLAASAALARAGYRVCEASSGGEALARILKEKERGSAFDLILTELSFQGMSAGDFLAKLREYDISTPMCALAGYRDDITVLDLLQKGCSGFLYKPFESTKLVNFVNDILWQPP